MNKKSKLLETKNKLKLLLALSTMGISALTTNSVVNAENNYSIEETEDSNTTTNEGFEPSTMSEYITYYSNVYGIKEEYIYDRLDYMFNENNDNKDFLELNTEEKVITVTRSIKKDNTISDDKYTGKAYIASLEPEEYIEKYSDILKSNKYIALSIAYSECAYPISSDWNYYTNGNLAGVGTSMYLGNKEEGVIETIFFFRDDWGITEDTDSSIFTEISKRYCPPNWEVWQSRATNYYNGLIENGYYSRATEEVQKKHKSLSLKKDD